jgi:lipoate-protein ligase A
MKIKKLLAAFTVVGAITVLGAIAFASPASIISELTGKTAEEIAVERNSGNSCGTIAKEAGVLEEFKEAMLEEKKERLAKKVEEGTLTEEKANDIILQIEERQENCDGTGMYDDARRGNRGGGKMCSGPGFNR